MFGLDKALLTRLFQFAAKRGLTALGLILIDRGYVQEGDWTMLVAGLVPIIADGLWMLYDKAKAEKREATARGLPQGATKQDVTDQMAARG